MNNSGTYKDYKYKWEGLIFNLICILYFLLLAPIIQKTAISSLKTEGSYMPWLGGLLILISLLEIYAFPKKMRYVHAAIKIQNGNIGNGFILWMFHSIISIILIFSTVQAFGFDLIGEDKDVPWWMIFLFIAVVIKELYFLGMIFIFNTNTEIPEKYQRPNKTEWIVDLILIIYACITYTVSWQVLSNGMDMEKDNNVMYVVNCFVAGLIFLIFYMPLRIPYYLEEIAQLKTDWDWLKFLGPLLLMVIIVILSL